MPGASEGNTGCLREALPHIPEASRAPRSLWDPRTSSCPTKYWPTRLRGRCRRVTVHIVTVEIAAQGHFSVTSDGEAAPLPGVRGCLRKKGRKITDEPIKRQSPIIVIFYYLWAIKRQYIWPRGRFCLQLTCRKIS